MQSIAWSGERHRHTVCASFACILRSECVQPTDPGEGALKARDSALFSPCAADERRRINWPFQVSAVREVDAADPLDRWSCSSIDGGPLLVNGPPAQGRPAVSGGRLSAKAPAFCEESVSAGLPARQGPHRRRLCFERLAPPTRAGDLFPCNSGSDEYVPQPQSTRSATWRDASASLGGWFCL